jgi:hypothetical protein
LFQRRFSMSFVIPVNPADLLLDRPGRYVVTDVGLSKLKPAAIVAKLDDASEALVGSAFAITENRVFDLLFACAR